MSFVHPNAVLSEARIVLKNKALERKQLIEFSADERAVRQGIRDNEIVVHLPKLALWLAVLQRHDRRNGTNAANRTDDRHHFNTKEIMHAPGSGRAQAQGKTQ